LKEVKVWTGLNWLWIASSCGFFWPRYWSFGLHERREISSET